MEQDLFLEYLEGRAGKSAWRIRALTDKSVKGHVLEDEDVNTELATYGDAVLKLALCELLLDQVDELTIEKQKYESDVALVRIGEYYDITKYLRFDRDNPGIPQDYRFIKMDPKFSTGKKEKVRKFNRKRKYIATAIEAVLGAIYHDHRDFAEILAIVGKWKQLTDSFEAE